MQALEKRHPDLEVVVIRMRYVPLIDQSGAYALEQFVEGMQEAGIVVCLTGLRREPEQVLRTLGIIPAIIPEERVFANFREAIQALVPRANQ